MERGDSSGPSRWPTAASCRSRSCSSSWVPIPAPVGSPTSSRATPTGSSSRARRPRPRGCWRPACRVCMPPETCAPARSSAARPRSARVLPWCASCTSTSPARRSGPASGFAELASGAELTPPRSMPKLRSIHYRMEGGARMRLPNAAHTSRPWRIHELTRDFRLEDVWALPTPGGPEDFPRLVQAIASGDVSRNPSWVARALWAMRSKLGELLGWDRPAAGIGSRVPTLRDRLPADLREAPSGPVFDTLPFSSLYLLEDEWAAEIANQTVHGVLHLGWVAEEGGGYRGQMAILVKPNGLLGSVYMA